MEDRVLVNVERVYDLSIEVDMVDSENLTIDGLKLYDSLLVVGDLYLFNYLRDHSVLSSKL